MTLEGRNQCLYNSTEVESSFQTGLDPRGVEPGGNFWGAEENSSWPLFFSLPPLLQHCPSTCSSVGSGSFLEKAICDLSYQSQGVWKPVHQSLGRGNKQQKRTLHKSLKPDILHKWPGSHGLLMVSDLATKLTSLCGSSCSRIYRPSSLSRQPKASGMSSNNLTTI